VARHSPNSSARAADRVDAAQRHMLRWHRRGEPEHLAAFVSSLSRIGAFSNVHGKNS